jgi:hypothetical protein
MKRGESERRGEEGREQRRREERLMKRGESERRG